MTSPPETRARRRPRRQRGEGEAGQALVEFLIVVPLLVALLAGTFELGWYAHARSVLATASLQAARTASIEGAVGPDALQAGDRIVSGGSIPAADVSWRLCVGGDCEDVPAGGSAGLICAISAPGQQLPQVSATATDDYHLLFPFLSSPLFLGIGDIISGRFSSTTTMPAEVGWIAGVNGPPGSNGAAQVCA